MRGLVRYVPRRYRAVALKGAVGAALLVVVYLVMMSGEEQTTRGAGRSDDTHFEFDDRLDIAAEIIDRVGVEAEAEGEQQAQAPGKHLGDAEVVDDKVGGNFSEEAMLKQEKYEYYTEEELQPRFKRPAANPSALGEYGRAARITDSSEEVKKKIKEGWDKHAFNHYVCEKISLHRSVGDKRDKECKERKWRKPVPDTSVIIIFHNEAWCALLRTVHSVLENSPKILLKEIILVDDASTFGDLGQKLDDYIAKLEVVKIIRLPQRSGLIQARLAGAEAAEGKVLTFLDSHCECAPHWLEPLLERIAEDPTRVVCPVIEVIDSDTFAMSLTTARNVPLGAFGWGLEFRWATQPGNKGMEIQEHAKDEAFTTPVMAGAVFSVDKEHFFRVGAYDEGMDGHGSENLELSFRIWICGGSIEIVPCSRVGHIGRRRKPYMKKSDQEGFLRNKIRVVELWMGDYKWMFYRRTPMARNMYLPDVDDRQQLHKELQCGNFEWYMKEICPDLYIVPYEDLVLHGEIRCSSNEEWCLESNNLHGNPGSIVDVAPCHQVGKGQYYELTEQGEIRQNTISELCLAARGTEIWTEKCRHPWHDVPTAHKWLVLPDGHIYHPESNLCLTGNVRKRSAQLIKCVKQATSQLWKFGQRDGYQETPAEEETIHLVEELVEKLTGNATDSNPKLDKFIEGVVANLTVKDVKKQRL